jgi:hypothetical protein
MTRAFIGFTAAIAVLWASNAALRLLSRSLRRKSWSIRLWPNR